LTSWVDAHGVAIIDSQPDEEFKYRQGDTFWLFVGANTSQYQKTVPVINLQTRQHGMIGIDNVCWFPKIQGPGKIFEES
jgi:hypothetical protein